MKVNRYEGLSREPLLAVPLLDFVIVLLVLLMVTGPPSLQSSAAPTSVSEETMAGPIQRVDLHSGGQLRYRGEILSVDRFKRKYNGSSVTLNVDSDVSFATLQSTVARLERAGLKPRLTISANKP